MENNIVMTNSSNFKENTIKLILNDLAGRKIIENEEQKNKLFEVYMNDKRTLEDIIKELNVLTKEDIINKITKQKSKEEPKENKVSLDNITDFAKEDSGRNFILIHYPYPDERIKVVENLTNKYAKDIFEALKDENGLVSIDGFVQSVEVFENSIEPEKNEVKMHDITELAKEGNFKKLTYEQQKMVIAVIDSVINEMAGINEQQKQRLRKTPIEELVKMFNKNIYLSPEENIVTMCVPGDLSKDRIQTVTKDAKGNYKLTSLSAVGYSYVNEEQKQEDKENVSPENTVGENEASQKENVDDPEKGVSYWKKKRPPKKETDK